MKLGVLRTKIIEDHAISEGGFFELEVTVDEGAARQSGDLHSFFNKRIGTVLAAAIMDTGVPIEYWTFAYEDRPARRYQLPHFLDFGVTS